MWHNIHIKNTKGDDILKIDLDFGIIKRYVYENKRKCLKIAGITAVFLIAFSIYLASALTKNDAIIILSSTDSETSATLTVGLTIESEQEQENEAEPQFEEKIIIVDIEGAVENPGVFYLQEGSRVNDAVQEAGGLTDDADTRWVNLAARLADGDKVYIPKRGHEKDESSKPTRPVGIITQDTTGGSALSGTGTSNDMANVMVNINTATSAQLQTLSGVGPVTAQKIIDYRENVGNFSKIEDIMRVSGIGQKTFDGFKDKITI